MMCDFHAVPSANNSIEILSGVADIKIVLPISVTELPNREARAAQVEHRREVMLQRLVAYLWGSTTTSSERNKDRTIGAKRSRSDDEGGEVAELGNRGSPLHRRQFRPDESKGDNHRHLPEGGKQAPTPSRVGHKAVIGSANRTRGALTAIMHNQAVSNAWDEPLIGSSARAQHHNARQSADHGQPAGRTLMDDFSAVSPLQNLRRGRIKTEKGQPVDDDDDNDAGPPHLVEDTLLCAQLCSDLSRMRMKPFLDYRDEQETRFDFEDALAAAEYRAVMDGVIYEEVLQTTTQQLGSAWSAFSDLIRNAVVDIIRKRAPPAAPGVLKAIASQKPSPIPLGLDEKDWDKINAFGLVEGMTERGGGTNAKDVVLPAQGFNIQRYQLATLLGRSWLNDQVINYYYKVLEGQFPGVVCLGSHFYTKLANKDFDGAARWTRRQNIFASDVVFIVVNNGVHWTLCVVLIREETIAYLDSCGDRGQTVLANVQEFMQREYDRHVSAPLASGNAVGKVRKAPRRWRLCSPCKAVPQQANGYDCGVFACQFGLAVARTRTFCPAMDFSQKEIPFVRQLMLLELIQGKLLRRL